MAKPLTLARSLIAVMPDLGAYIYHQATTGSVYIKFDDERLGSLRIADHRGRERYRYRWNLWVHGPRMNGVEIEDRGVRRYHYSYHHIEELMAHLRRYRRRIAWQPKKAKRISD